MTEPEEQNLEEPQPADVPEPDQEPHEEEQAEEEEQPSEPVPDEADTPQAQGVTPEEWERRSKKLEKSYSTYTNAFSRIYEESANDFFPCPLCADTPAGFIHPDQIGTFPAEIQEVVDTLLGRTTVAAFETAPDTEQCPRCKGKGMLATGSLVPAWQEKTCESCNGAGFIGPGNPMFSPPVQNVTATHTDGNGEAQNFSAALAAVEAAKQSAAGR